MSKDVIMGDLEAHCARLCGPPPAKSDKPVYVQASDLAGILGLPETAAWWEIRERMGDVLCAIKCAGDNWARYVASMVHQEGLVNIARQLNCQANAEAILWAVIALKTQLPQEKK